MRTTFATLAIALSALLPQEPPAGQDKLPVHDQLAGQGTPPRPPGHFETEAERAARAREEILGAWQLTRGEIPVLGVNQGGVAGYALFLEGYMSLEFHVAGNTASDSANTFFQTGTHRWKIEDNGVLSTYGLIGTHNITEDEEYDFEEPGQRREYRAKIEGETLTLEKTDRTARFTFTRLGKLRFPDAKDGATDFYGRPVKPAPKEPEKRPGEKSGG